MMLVASAMSLPVRLVAVFYFGLATYVTLSIKNEDKFGVKAMLPRTISDYLILVGVCALVLGITGLDLSW